MEARKAPNPMGRVGKMIDPDELLTVIIAIGLIWSGFSTYHDLIGKPQDAPHLQVSGEVRAALWVGAAILGLVALAFPRTSMLRRWALSPMGMGAMITARLASYIASWVVSWEWVDALVPDEKLQGDPNAYGSIWIYILLELLIVCLMFSPWDWKYLDRPAPRPARIEGRCRVIAKLRRRIRRE